MKRLLFMLAITLIGITATEIRASEKEHAQEIQAQVDHDIGVIAINNINHEVTAIEIPESIKAEFVEKEEKIKAVKASPALATDERSRSRYNIPLARDQDLG